MTQSPPDKSPPAPNPRVIAMLTFLTLIISASVIATDIFSMRNRNPVPTTSPTSR